MTAMVMLRLRFGLVNRFGGIGVVGRLNSAATVALDRAAKEAVDHRRGLLCAARERFGKAAWTVGTLLPFPFALFLLGLAGVPFARVRFTGAVVAILMVRAADLVTAALDPAEAFE